jgi:hypothetical protein
MPASPQTASRFFSIFPLNRMIARDVSWIERMKQAGLSFTIIKHIA